MGERTKNLLIGIFVIAASALIVWMVMFLKPTVGDGKQTLYVRFSDVNKIPIGTRVMLAGKPVGEVVAIESIPEARSKPSSDILGHLYYYQLVLKIDSHVKVYDTDEIAVQTSGLLGEKSIAIIPRPAPPGVTPQLLTSKQVVYAKSADPLERVFSQFTDLSDTIKRTFQEVTCWIQDHGDDVANAVQAAENAMQEITTVARSINEHDLIGEMSNTIDTVNNTVIDIQNAVQQLEEAGTFANAGIMMKNMKNASVSIDQITRDIACGKGTLGRLVKGDDLYMHVNAILSKIDILMNDINHYGVLFHLNKSWQRQRIQRITVLNALDTPSGFKNYFESEVDEINAAMERISMLLDKMQAQDQMSQDPTFQQDFTDLLRQADTLSENLKLYNQQLIDAQDDP